MRRYPVVTGIGVVSPIGTGREGFERALFEGANGVVRREEDDRVPCRVHAPVRGFDPKTMIPGPRKNHKIMSRAVKIGMAAAGLAMADAGLAPGAVEPRRFGAFMGAGASFPEGRDLEPALELATREGRFDIVAFGEQGLGLVNPLWLLKGLANNVLAFVSAHYRMMGPNLNICNSGVSGLQAIGEAAQAIKDGAADVCLAGGYDSLVVPEHMALYAKLGLLTESRDPEAASRPFHARRDGFVPGEGGAFVVVEDLEHAKARGAKIWGHVLGYGSTDSAHDLAATDPDGDGILAAASAALRDAGVPPVEVGMVVAHASGSVQYDPIEAMAIGRLLGPARDRIPVTAPKASIGHTIAASGAFGAVTLLLALSRHEIPPTRTLDDVAPGCELNHVTQPREHRGRPHGLVLAAGLGGQHAALYLGEDPY